MCYSNRIIYNIDDVEMSHQKKYYKVADITIELGSDYPISENTFHPLLKQFEVTTPGLDMACIHHHFSFPDFSGNTRKKFTEVYKNDQFRIFKTQTSWIFYYTSIFPNDLPQKAIGIMNSDFSSVHIHTTDLTGENYKNGTFKTLTLFNTDQMLFAKLLCDRNGIMVHANGFNINGSGILLAGISGSGKSTLSNILQKPNNGYEILCDDRMFIRKKDGKFWIFGNWCYGSHPCTSPSAAPLQGFMFLEKGVKNKITEIRDKHKIMPRLLQVIVKPLLDKKAWHRYFLTIEDMMKNIRFYTIEFDLSGDIYHEINTFLRIHK